MHHNGIMVMIVVITEVCSCLVGVQSGLNIPGVAESYTEGGDLAMEREKPKGWQ